MNQLPLSNHLMFKDFHAASPLIGQAALKSLLEVPGLLAALDRKMEVWRGT